MLYEEYFNKEDNKVQRVFVSCLLGYLTHPNLSVFDELLLKYEEEERYLECAGLSKAMGFIEERYNIRFDEAAEAINQEDDEEIILRQQDYEKANKLVFQDILDEFIQQTTK